MSKYRARHCPNCNYFVGFTVARKHVKGRPISIANFCLNCNYKLPVYSIVRGIRTPTRVSRRTTLRLVRGKPELPGLDFVGRNRNHAMDVRISPADYARHLRAIGQDLENLHLTTFNLEYVGDAYLVWVRADEQSENNNPLFRISKNRLQKLWRNKMPPRTLGHEEPYALSATQTGKRLRYAIPESRSNRKRATGAPSPTKQQCRWSLFIAIAPNRRRSCQPKGRPPAGHRLAGAFDQRGD